MYAAFTKFLCGILVNNEFEILHHNNESLVPVLALYKSVPPALYGILVVNADADANAGVSEYSKIEEKHRAFFERSLEHMSCNYAIMLTIFVSESAESCVLSKIPPDEFMIDRTFYSIRWTADITERRLVINSKEVSEISNFRAHIETALTDFSDTEEGITLSDLQHSNWEKSRVMPRSKGVYATVTVIGINIILFLLLKVLTGELFGLYIREIGAISQHMVFGKREFYRLFSSIFLHSDWAHLAYNCLGIYIFGSKAEKYMGRYTFIALYVASGMISGLVATLLISQSYTVGASGAIFGTAGALIAYTLIIGRSLDGFNCLTLSVITIGMLAPGYLMSNVNNMAHLIGLLAGFVSAWLLVSTKWYREAN